MIKDKQDFLDQFSKNNLSRLESILYLKKLKLIIDDLLNTDLIIIKEKRKLKQCSKNPSHIWDADISYCPYCNLSSDVRIDYSNRKKDVRKFIKKLKEV